MPSASHGRKLVWWTERRDPHLSFLGFVSPATPSLSFDQGDLALDGARAAAAAGKLFSFLSMAMCMSMPISSMDWLALPPVLLLVIHVNGVVLDLVNVHGVVLDLLRLHVLDLLHVHVVVVFFFFSPFATYLCTNCSR